MLSSARLSCNNCKPTALNNIRFFKSFQYFLRTPSYVTTLIFYASLIIYELVRTRSVRV